MGKRCSVGGFLSWTVCFLKRDPSLGVGQGWQVISKRPPIESTIDFIGYVSLATARQASVLVSATPADTWPMEQLSVFMGDRAVGIGQHVHHSSVLCYHASRPWIALCGPRSDIAITNVVRCPFSYESDGHEPRPALQTVLRPSDDALRFSDG